MTVEAPESSVPSNSRINTMSEMFDAKDLEITKRICRGYQKINEALLAEICRETRNFVEVTIKGYAYEEMWIFSNSLREAGWVNKITSPKTLCIDVDETMRNQSAP